MLTRWPPGGPAAGAARHALGLSHVRSTEGDSLARSRHGGVGFKDWAISFGERWRACRGYPRSGWTEEIRMPRPTVGTQPRRRGRNAEIFPYPARSDDR